MNVDALRSRRLLFGWVYACDVTVVDGTEASGLSRRMLRDEEAKVVWLSTSACHPSRGAGGDRHNDCEDTRVGILSDPEPVADVECVDAAVPVVRLHERRFHRRVI